MQRAGGSNGRSLERAVLVYTTFPSIGEAEQAGQALVERRLCACVNILPGMVSLYWWQGAIDRGDEVVMIIKTRATLAEPVRAAVKEAALLYDAGNSGDSARGVDPDYQAWIVAETRGGYEARETQIRSSPRRRRMRRSPPEQE